MLGEDTYDRTRQMWRDAMIGLGEGKQKSKTVGQKIAHLSDRSCALFSSLFLPARLDLCTKNYSVKSKLLDVGGKKAKMRFRYQKLLGRLYTPMCLRLMRLKLLCSVYAPKSTCLGLGIKNYFSGLMLLQLLSWVYAPRTTWLGLWTENDLFWFTH